MKVRFAVAVAATLFAGALAIAADGSWTGWISDSQCGVKGANEKAGECTTKCVKEHGAKYVFVNDADKKEYVVDAQDKVAAHAGDHDVMAGTDSALRSITRKVSEYGTTSLVATTVTASTDQTLRVVEGISGYIAQQHETEEPRAEVLGIHFEGPFISKERRGVHPSQWIQLPSAETLSRFLKAAAGNARILTIAPEVLGAAPCIDAAREGGLS